MTRYRRPLAFAAMLASFALPAAAGQREAPPPAPAAPSVTASPRANAEASAAAAASARASSASSSRSLARGGNASSTAAGGRAAATGGYSGGNSQSIDARSAPAVFAPALTTSNDTCAGSATAGGSGSVFGLILGGTWQFPDCNRRANANQALRNGNPAIAHELMCEDQGYRHAALRAGQPCAADLAQQQQAAVAQAVAAQAVAQAPARPSYCRPLPRNASAADRLMQARNCG